MTLSVQGGFDLMLDENSDESDGTMDELIVNAMIRGLLSIEAA